MKEVLRFVTRRAPGAGATRIDLHAHSAASFDCTVEPHLVARQCQTLGLEPVFLTDHDTVAGAEALRLESGRAVVTGQEITTSEGELIGLFLRRPVAAGATPTETALRIREQGGLVYLPHPLDPTRASLPAEAIDRLGGHIDVVEVFNGRSPAEANETAADLCRYLGAVAGAGSDAHSLEELGGVCVEIEEFDGPRDFLHKLERARIVRKPGRARLRVEARLRALGERCGSRLSNQEMG